MYKKYLEHVVLAMVRYFFNYDHDLKCQLLVIVSFIALFAKKLVSDSLNLARKMQDKTTGLMQAIKEMKDDKNENENQEMSSVRNYIKKDIISWQLNNG